MPHVSATAELDEPLVWAVDTRHLPFYWFPRDCPRGTFWADAATDPGDAARLLGGATRVHAIEDGLARPDAHDDVFAYRLPEAAFEPHPDVGGYWVSRETVEPLELRPLGDLVALHERRGDRAPRRAEPVAALERRRRLDARVQRHAAAERAARP